MPDLTVIGGGLAGSEAAWQAAEQGMTVELYEMRPGRQTGAHLTDGLAELVCSNSLGSNLPDRAAGVLKAELRKMDSLLIRIADMTAVPAGGALAVDRDAFSARVTDTIRSHPNISVIHNEVTELKSGLTIVATGPLTSPAFAQEIMRITGSEHLFFYDAIAPIIYQDLINFNVAFRASRYGHGEQDAGDYINCPMSQVEYENFVEALISSERIELKEFERDIALGVKAGSHHFFEGRLPVEVLAMRGRQALAYGPMRPVGLKDPRTGKRPYAVVQLRQDNQAGSLYNLVGFQTNLTYGEQKRVLRMIPGLERAEFARYGQMHRNTFVFSPAHLEPTLHAKARTPLFFAGQITGVEGYVGNFATGLLAGWNAARMHTGKPLVVLPETTMLGALIHYITHASAADFQPMKANFGLLPSLDETEWPGRDKRSRLKSYGQRALRDLDRFLADNPIRLV